MFQIRPSAGREPTSAIISANHGLQGSASASGLAGPKGAVLHLVRNPLLAWCLPPSTPFAADLTFCSGPFHRDGNAVFLVRLARVRQGTRSSVMYGVFHTCLQQNNLEFLLKDQVQAPACHTPPCADWWVWPSRWCDHITRRTNAWAEQSYPFFSAFQQAQGASLRQDRELPSCDVDTQQ